MNTRIALILLAPLLTTQFGCQRAIRNVKYSAYEKIGIDKRDLVRKRVTNAKEEQQEAREEFKDALTRLQEITKVDGGALEKTYNDLKDSYEDATAEANDVRESIKAVETVAGDLFREWEKEIEEISTSSLKNQSKRMLRQTRKRYQELEHRLKAAEKKMEPVLTQLNDQVLFLKHNLNAQAVAALRGTTRSIEKDIESLIVDMNQSIAQAERFIASLEGTNE